MAINKLETAKQLVKEGKMSQEVLDILFPELKESEDERIMKNIITFLDELFSLGKNTNFDKWSKSDCAEWIAWIKKQGEPKVIIPNFRVGDIIRLKNSDAEYKITEISDGYYRGKGWCLDIVAGDESDDYELVKQNLAWSEEDSFMIDKAESWLDTLCDYLKDSSSDCISEVRTVIDRLKALKNRTNQGIIES